MNRPAALLALGALACAGTPPHSEDPHPPPDVTILAPDDGALFTEGSPISFMGHAATADRTEDIWVLAWSSSRDGLLHDDPLDDDNHSRFEASLSAGTHAVFFDVEDSRGQWNSDEVIITVEAE